MSFSKQMDALYERDSGLVHAGSVSMTWQSLAHLTVMFALPMSPLVENLTPSLVTEIATVSPMLDKSLRQQYSQHFG